MTTYLESKLLAIILAIALSSAVSCALASDTTVVEQKVVPLKAPCGEFIVLSSRFEKEPSEDLRKRLASVAMLPSCEKRESVIRDVLTAAKEQLGDKHQFVAVCLYELAANYCPQGIMLTPKTDGRWRDVNMKEGDFEKRKTETLKEFESRQSEAKGWIKQADVMSALVCEIKDPNAVADEYYELNKLQPWSPFEDGAQERFESVVNSSADVRARRHALVRLAEFTFDDALRLASLMGNLAGLERAEAILEKERSLRDADVSDAESRFADELRMSIDSRIDRIKKSLQGH